MYSIVLMAAVSGGPNTTGADATPVVVAPTAVVVGCTGCTGCTGYYSSCYGSCYGSCNGCYGSCHGRGGLFGHRHSCSGCSGCCGGGFLGHKHSCHGCCGGYSCFGSCNGCYGQSWGYGYGYGGCCGGYAGCWGASYSYPVYGASPAYGAYPAPAPAPMVIPVEPKPAPKTEEKKSGSNGASLKFQLPADATLYVDGRQTAGDGAERAFFTPPLEGGQKYFYDVRAEVVVDGKTISEEKRVVVETGAQITASFPKLLAAAGGATTVAGK
ncbi:MAG: hypothetical protein JWO38_3597 [Gemmataceae bacterium]|nr:hypothetical protein [Gemmataceae bacterium]